jgi:hypothetical protein
MGGLVESPESILAHGASIGCRAERSACHAWATVSSLCSGCGWSSAQRRHSASSHPYNSSRLANRRRGWGRRQPTEVGVTSGRGPSGPAARLGRYALRAWPSALPTGGRRTGYRLDHVVVGHQQEAAVDHPLLAAGVPIAPARWGKAGEHRRHRGLSVRRVIDPRRHAGNPASCRQIQLSGGVRALRWRQSSGTGCQAKRQAVR